MCQLICIPQVVARTYLRSLGYGTSRRLYIVHNSCFQKEQNWHFIQSSLEVISSAVLTSVFNLVRIFHHPDCFNSLPLHSSIRLIIFWFLFIWSLLFLFWFFWQVLAGFLFSSIILCFCIFSGDIKISALWYPFKSWEGASPHSVLWPKSSSVVSQDIHIVHFDISVSLRKLVAPEIPPSVLTIPYLHLPELLATCLMMTFQKRCYLLVPKYFDPSNLRGLKNLAQSVLDLLKHQIKESSALEYHLSRKGKSQKILEQKWRLQLSHTLCRSIQIHRT